ncbi:hypothetical protein HF325_006832 [Metschnikowia pulcherrima]|uniref:V-type proton ATPase subunit F n=1 Tax=Metschnikowia pulcherrima TaxID=27326 RepID=A0A8H7LB68_9ASCO|nr:hypothetical protein HF325_006832 [Metschnikowia pulcherrima]
MAKRSLLAVIADQDSVTGLLLAEVGQVYDEPGKETYFLTVIPGKTTEEEVEEAFDRFTSGRDDIALLLINQHIASRSDIQELSARRDIELFNGHQESRLKDHNRVFFLPLHKMQYAAFSVLWPSTVSAYSRYTLAHYLI